MLIIYAVRIEVCQESLGVMLSLGYSNPPHYCFRSFFVYPFLDQCACLAVRVSNASQRARLR